MVELRAMTQNKPQLLELTWPASITASCEPIIRTQLFFEIYNAKCMSGVLPDYFQFTVGITLDIYDISLYRM